MFLFFELLRPRPVFAESQWNASHHVFVCKQALWLALLVAACVPLLLCDDELTRSLCNLVFSADHPFVFNIRIVALYIIYSWQLSIDHSAVSFWCSAKSIQRQLHTSILRFYGRPIASANELQSVKLLCVGLVSPLGRHVNKPKSMPSSVCARIIGVEDCGWSWIVWELVHDRSPIRCHMNYIELVSYTCRDP